MHFFLINHEKFESIRIDMLDDIRGPGSLPAHLIFINQHLPIQGNFVTTYDIDHGVLSIFDDCDSFKAGRVKSRVKINTFYI